MNSADYAAFLASKSATAPQRGLSAIPPLGSHLFPFQAHCVEMGLRAGSWMCALDTGLGKTLCELEYLTQTLPYHNGVSLILTPLAVARQIEREGQRFGYDVRVIREQSEARMGINICNYDRLDRLDPDAYGAVALDESSILKSFTGKTSRALTSAFERHRWRMAATATPAPNDHTELAQHAEFLGVLSRDEMLVRWFIHDSNDTKTWRLKRHGVNAFYDWLASWSRMAQHPRDLGFDMPGFELPSLNVIRHRVESNVAPEEGSLFNTGANVSATSIHDIKRQTSEERARKVAELFTSDSEPWAIWCDTDYEADALLRLLGDRSDIVEVRGSHTTERKEKSIAEFGDGTKRGIITKGSITGFGLNWQHCNKTAFVGRSFSYETWYQCVRRFWRFGQKSPVDAHVIVADGEDAIGRVIDRKSEDHKSLKAAMTAAMIRSQQQTVDTRIAYAPTHEGRLPSWM